MEPRLPQFNHHHHERHHHLHSDTRYASMAPPPPPPPPPPHPPLRFLEDRNFFHHQHLPPPPPPPPPHHHSHQFPYPIEENRRNHGFDLENPSRVSDRYHHRHPEDHPHIHHQSDFRRNSYVEDHPDVWDPPRVPTNNRPIHIDVWDPPRVPDNNRRVRPFPIEWDDDHRDRDHLFNHPMSPFREAPKGNLVNWKRFGEDREGSSFREFSRDGFDLDKKEELLWDRRDHRGNSSNGDRNYLSRRGFNDPSSLSSGKLTFKSAPSASRYVFGSGSNKGQQSSWVDGEEPVNGDRGPRPSLREVGSFGHNEPSVSNHSTIGMVKEEMGSDFWVSEDGRQVITGKHLNHQPKYNGKHFHHQSKYGKFKSMVSDNEGSEEFIHTPKKRTSALLRVQLGKTTPRKWKDENLDDPNSGSARVRGPLMFLDHGPEEHKEGNPVELDVSFKSNALVAKAIMASSSPGVGSDGIHTPNIKKKREVMVPVSGLSTLKVPEIRAEPINGESSTHGPDAASSSSTGLTQLEDKVTVDGIEKSSLNGINVSLKNKAVKESPSIIMVSSDKMHVSKMIKKKKKKKVIAPVTKVHEGGVLNREKSSAHGMGAASSSVNGLRQPLEENRAVVGPPSSPVVGSEGICTPKVKKRKTVMAPRSRLSSSTINESRDGHVNADDSTHGVDVASSSLKGLKQLEEKRVLLGSVSRPMAGSNVKSTPKVKKKNIMAPSLGLSKIIGHVNVDRSTYGVSAASSSDRGLTQSKNEIKVFGVRINDIGLQPKLGITKSTDSPAVESLPSPVVCSDDTPKIKKKKRVVNPSSVLSSSVHQGPVNADNSTPCADDAFTSNKDLAQPEEKVIASVIGTTSDRTALLESRAVDKSQSSPIVGSDGTFTPKIKKKRKLISCNLGLSASQIPDINEGPIDADGCNHATDAPSNSDEVLMRSGAKAMVSRIETMDDISLPSLQKLPVILENCMEEGSHTVVIPEIECVKEVNVINSTHANMGTNSLITDDVTELGNGRREGQSMVNKAEGHGIDGEYREDFALDSQIQEKSDSSTLELHTSVLVERSTDKAMEDESCNLMITNSNEEVMESVPDKDTIIDSEESVPIVTSNRPVEKPMGRDSIPDVEVNVKSNQTMQNENSVPEKTLSLPSQETEQPASVLKPKGGELIVGKTHQGPPIPRVLPSRSSLASGSLKEKASSTHIARRRTWCRTDHPSPFPHEETSLNTGPSRRQLPKKFGKLQSTSYIRKGNSLVRNCAPIAGSESKVNNIDPLERLRMGIERPKTPPLPHNTKLPNYTTKGSRDVTSLTLAGLLSEGGSETTPDYINLTESKDVAKHPGTSENQAGVDLKSEAHDIFETGRSKSSKTKSIMYVKRKSNQLVASRSPEICDPSVNVAENTQAAPSSTHSDQYYKRNKNQLIRNAPSSGNHFKLAIAIPDDSSNSEGQRAPKVSYMKSNKYLSKRRTDKVSMKTRKPSKFSLVWTLQGTQSQNEDSNSLQRRKVFPYLFPWKRMAYYNSAPVSNKSSVSLISRKLLFSRKRDAVYIRSTGGFSLRKSKVLSIGGSNLKWSKSIESRSKKANEEATLAVAAVQKKKRELKGAACAVTSSKNRNPSSRKSVHSIELRPGERIFRIGSVRYKMDSSRRTLQRIPDERSSCTVDIQSGKDAKKYLIPKRLLIGNDEYIRIGNGNQLVRDPKKHVRILASEKIRWSLHTARLRLARKQQYCQFFTRFGKCNKDGGKCPYIHDPAKIAVCTKFLKGLCSNTNCKLTHKVIPERMPDCSYFLQGLCTNQNCPYRHVNVNPNASVCEGFLRGYCADGDKCCKKHSYVCPLFEATGVCPQGSMCKLHHPKNCSKTKIRKRTKNAKTTKGRYFGSGIVDVNKTRTAASEKHNEQKNEDIFLQEGRLSDYISLDVREEESQDTNDPMDIQTNVCDSDHPDLQSDDLDEIIKPIRIMNKTISSWLSAALVHGMQAAL